MGGFERILEAEDRVIAMPWGMGLSIGLDLGSVMGGSRVYYPTDKTGWYVFLDPNRLSGQISGTTMRASGTTPPVVTLAGTRTVLGALRIEIQSSTTFRWCDDNTSTGSFAGFTNSGITIPAGGAPYNFGNGLSATFPTGTYSNQVYQETVASIASQSNGSHLFAQATANKQPLRIKGVNGCFCLRFDGTDDTISCLTPDLPVPSVGAPIWVWGIVRYDAFTSFDALFSGNSGCYVETATSTTARMNYGANGPVITYAVGTAARMIVKYTGSTSDSFKWGSAAPITGVTSGAGNSTAGIWFGSNRDLASSYANCTIGAIGLRNTELTGSDLTALENWAIAQYGAGLF
jgi:hypothetical protein